MPITSAQNSKIKLVNRLRGKRGRQREARFVIDYERDLQRALRLGYDIDFILYCPDLGAQPDCAGIDAHQVEQALFTRVSYRENPTGIIAVMRSKPAKRLAQLRATDHHHVVALVGLAVPGNIGALMRSADAAGIDALILVDTALDLYNPNVIRSSTGACFLNNIYQLSGDEALAFFTSARFQIIAADIGGERTLYEVDFQPKSVIALGGEDQGLPKAWIDRADHVARIPMQGAVSDSLNVSVSGALFVYEMVRQKLAASQKG